MKSKDCHFQKGNLIYHDTYFRGRSFILNENVREKDVYNFLRQVLMQEYDDEIPVLRPAKFSDGEWGYTFSVKGALGNFAGKEEISLNRRIVYRCFVHGGFIK